MKKYIFVLLTILVTASLILGGCSSTTTSPSSTPASSQVATTTKAPAPATTTVVPTNSTAPLTSVASGKVYEFKFTDQFTAQQTSGVMNELIGKLISEKTNGRVKFTYYHSESLGKAADFLKMMNGGIVDAASITPVSYPTQLDVELGGELPGLGIPNRQARLDLTWELLNKGYLTGLAPYKVLGFQPTPNLTFFLKKKAATIADLKGLKIRTSSDPMVKVVNLVGGSPLAIPFSDVYMSMDRGVIDGLITAYEAFLQAKLYEVSKYAVTDPLASGCTFVIMTKTAWDSLPKDLQAQVDEAIQAYRPAFLAMVKEPDDAWGDLLKKQGVDVYGFSPAEADKLKSLIAPVKNDWVTEHQAKGITVAKDMMDYIDKYIANYK